MNLLQDLELHEDNVVRARIGTATNKSQEKFWTLHGRIGIHEEQRHRLFQKFSQLDYHSAPRHEGTGLVLAINK